MDPKQVTKGVWPAFRKLFKVQSCYTVREPPAQVAAERRSITYRRYDHLHKVQTEDGNSPRPAWSSSLPGSLDDDAKSGLKETIASSSDDSLSTAPFLKTAFIPDGMQSIGYADEDSQPDIRLPLYLDSSTSSSHSRPNDQFNVCLTADSTGKFGFNLRFEKERSSARLSRLIPNSSADMSYPPMHVGDELVAVEGHPVECLSQAELMEIFRAARQSSLTLSLRRSGHMWSDQDEGPSIQYVLEPTDMSARDSIAAISDGLRTGRILSHFDLLPRSRPELSSSVARRNENIQKNRYGDIFPCKFTNSYCTAVSKANFVFNFVTFKTIVIELCSRLITKMEITSTLATSLFLYQVTTKYYATLPPKVNIHHSNQKHINLTY